MERPHVLIVSWWFPPREGGGIYRPLNFSRYLLRHGYRVTVLTGSIGPHERVDPSLLERLPEGLRILRCPFWDPFRGYDRAKRWLSVLRPSRSNLPSSAADNGSGSRSDAAMAEATWKDLLSESLALPDRWRSWVVPATMRAALGLAGDEPDLIFTTSPPHSMHLIGRKLKALFQCPWVVDFRDPWVGNPFRDFRAAQLLPRDEALEKKVIADADQIITNTPALEDLVRQRYPDLEKVRTITNGFDPEQFRDAREVPAPDSGSGLLEVLHVGHLYGARSGRYLIRGLQKLKELDESIASRFRIRLVGAIDNEESYRAEVRDRGVEDLLLCDGRVPHDRALELQRQAPALLILGVEQPGKEVQVPGKLYEYFAAQKPVLTFSRPGGAIDRVLESARVPYEIGEPDDPDSIAQACWRFVQRQESGSLTQFDPDALRQFRYDELTRRLEECFHDALGVPVEC